MTGQENCRLAEALIRCLRAWGTEAFVVCPGARSSPLAAALGQGRDVVSHFEERGAAFYAMGRAQGSGRPTVVVTTSGSAVANLHPAAVEALHSEVPMIFLTADRPVRLRGTGANQTIDQRGIFGPSVLWWGEIPETGDRLAGGLSLVEEAWRTAMGIPMGPVHINCAFDEPLLAEPFDAREFTIPPPPHSPLACHEEVKLPEAGGRGLIVVGRLSEAEQAEGPFILELAEKLGWPIFADALSGLPARPPVIAHADLLLAAAEWPAPRAVLHIGGAVVSKRVGIFASKAPAGRSLQISRSPRAWDPWGQHPQKITGDPIAILRQIAAEGESGGGAGWIGDWVRASELAEAFLACRFANRLCEPGVARAVAAKLPEGSRLFLGNSLPIRDFDTFACWPGGRRRIHGNRGASGIDGNLATAAALAEYSPTVALVGDVTALHDLPSLALIRARSLPLVVVVINNQGGAIFRFLELPGVKLNPLWETSHSFSLAALASAFGWNTWSPRNFEEMNAAWEQALAGQMPALIEISSHPGDNLELHRSIVRDFSAELSRHRHCQLA